MHLKKHEHSLQGVETKIDDLKIKLNLVKKNEEYKALQNQIAHDNATKAKLEEEILLALDAIETKTAELAKLEADVKRFAGEVTTLQKQIEDQAVAQKDQLRELETAITEAEIAIPEDFRDHLPPDRRPLRRRCPGRLRGWSLSRLLHRHHRPDEERSDQPPFPLLLPQLRPAPLSHRCRDCQYATQVVVGHWSLVIGTRAAYHIRATEGRQFGLSSRSGHQISIVPGDLPDEPVTNRPVTSDQ